MSWTGREPKKDVVAADLSQTMARLVMGKLMVQSSWVIQLLSLVEMKLIEKSYKAISRKMTLTSVTIHVCTRLCEMGWLSSEKAIWNLQKLVVVHRRQCP